MLGKILLTVLVCLLAFMVVRQRRQAEGKTPRKSERRDTAAGATNGDNLSADLRMAAYLFLVLMVGIGAALYYYRWQDRHTVLTVTLYRTGGEAPVNYQVFKYQLRERSFVTVGGTSVTVAGSERMEIEGLNE